MRNKILLLLAIISVCLSINAQIKIDFNNGSGGKGYIADDFQAWDASVFKIESLTATETKELGGGVTITISHGENTDAAKICGSWNSNNLKTGGDYLINDGLTAKAADKINSGNFIYLLNGRMSVNVSIKGLSKGQHSLQAFHNNPENLTASVVVLPNVNVAVDGEVVLSDIPQSHIAETRDQSAKSYVTFDVEGTDDVTTITYFTAASSNDEYTRNNFFINGLIIDGSDVDNTAQNPSPANLDYHIDATNGVTLSWSEAVKGADQHVIYFSTDEEAVRNGTAPSVTQTTTSLSKTGLSPLERYYWRVDEILDGKTYTGEVWSFQPRRDAFPGAEGYGRYAIGGRGYKGNGKVYHVTSLDDDATNPQPGTFRYGILKETGPRTIVFDVSGVIHLKDRLTCSDPYVTIAGQTAPGNGIMFRGAPLGVASDGITRFVRLRRGDIVEDGNTITITLQKKDEKGKNVYDANGNPVKYDKEVPADCGKGLDGMGMAGNNHSIMDHCSIGWTIDEAFSSRNAKNITLQHTLISEALNIAGHPNYDAGKGHGYAATIGGDKGSYHHNLLAHNEGRNWSMGGGLLGSEYAGRADMFNNVCYNWGTRTTDGGVHNGQFVNNYYKMGPASTHTLLLTADLEGTGSGTQEYYVSGNIRQAKDNGAETTHSYKAGGDNNIYKYELSGGQVLDWTVFVNEPYFDSWATIETAKAAFKNVLSDVGCNYAGLDNHDVRMVSETLNGTTSTTGSKSGLKGLIDNTSDSEGWKKIEEEFGNHTRPDNWDVDGDGIPAWFETAKGWSETAPNNNVCSNKDYYTNLEEYLNWMAVPHFYNMANDGTVSGVRAGTIDLSTYFAGYTSPSFSAAIVGSNGASASVNGSTLTYDFASCTEKLVTINVTASEGGISLTRSFNFFIDASDVEEPEDPTVTPEGTPYTLSTETYKSSTNTTTWNFTPDDLTFTVTNSNNKGYSTGSENGVKYSAGVQYTIGIPTGIQVDYITFRGYDNYSGTDAYLGELNGTTCNATDYVFPQKDSEGKYTIAEHTIQLATPATGTLTFTPAGNQVVWVITLYTSEIKIELEDKKNTMEEVADGTETVTETGTITWVFNDGDEDQKATYSDGIKDYVSSASVTLGGKLEYNGTRGVNDITETLVHPTEQTNEASDDNAVTFSFTTKDNTTFTPTNVSYYISRIGTNNGTYSAKMNNNESSFTIANEEKPNRNEESYGWYTRKDNETVTNMSAAQTNSLVFNLWGLQTGKNFGLANVVITGDLTYQRQTTITTVTLDEMATVHDLPAEDNVTVKMKRGLTAEAWNTFCVPFNLTKAQLQTALSDDKVEIVKYTEQKGTTLYFEDIEDTDIIEAGKPYLIRPSEEFTTVKYDASTPTITFNGVNLVGATARSNDYSVAGSVQPAGADYAFVGTYVRYIMETDGTELGLNSKNKLAKPAASTNIMRGLRGFFRYSAGNGAGAKVVINGTLTSIDEIDGGIAGAKGVYHVSGRYVRSEWNNGSGLPRGLYIVNGQKMVK